MALRSGLALILAVAGCGGGEGVGSFGGATQPGVTGGPGGVSESTGGEASTGGTTGGGASAGTSEVSTSTSGGGASSDATVWDMGVPDFGAVQPAGCQGKIDFLFVVSADNLMFKEQGKLLAAFPQFMAAIAAEFADFDVHILSANTNQNIDLEDCGVCTDSCDPQGELPYCGGQFNACDRKIGASVVFPTGNNASNRRCELDSGLRYITSGQHDLPEAFACIARVGLSGGESVGQAMVAALSPAFNDPRDEDACNTGFLRDDALLVVTVIQNTYDNASLGTVDEWIAALRKAKHGDDDAFAVLALVVDDHDGSDPLCDYEYKDYVPWQNRLRLLAEGVQHGFVGSICADSYAPFFAEHVDVLADLCEDFVPPG